MSYKYYKFIKALEDEDRLEYNRRVFSVVYEDVPKPDSGVWMPMYHTFGCRHTITITLDDEDLTYLYNKYYDRAKDDLEKEKEDKEKKRQKEIEELEEKLRKLREK